MVCANQTGVNNTVNNSVNGLVNTGVNRSVNMGVNQGAKALCSTALGLSLLRNKLPRSVLIPRTLGNLTCSRTLGGLWLLGQPSS